MILTWMVCLFNFPAYMDCIVTAMLGICPHQALMHVVIDLIRIEVRMVQYPLYHVLQFMSVGSVFKDVFLQNAFALCEDVGCRPIQWWQVASLYRLPHGPCWNHHWLMVRNVLQ